MPANAVKMYPRLLSTGQRHTLASIECWDITCDQLRRIVWEDIQIFQGLVGHLAMDIDEYSSLHVFDWKTGQPLFVSRTRLSLNRMLMVSLAA
jgi:hypothetical protein